MKKLLIALLALNAASFAFADESKKADDKACCPKEEKACCKDEKACCADEKKADSAEKKSDEAKK